LGLFFIYSIIKAMKKKNILLLAVILLISTNIFAFQFTPISKDFDASGSGARQTFRVVNDTEKTIGVQIRALTREMDLYGVETLEDASNYFYVYPKQVVVKPDSYQTIRVQWRGPARVEQELPYRIEAEQLPLDFEVVEGGANLNILLVYRGTMYIVPEDIYFDAKLVSVAPHTDAEGNKKLAIEMKNDGNTHQIMYQPKLQITSSSNGNTTSKVTLEADKLSGFSGENLLAGTRRIFLVPWPDELKEGKLSATYEMENIR
jgi:fimbrial chaperone protein